MNDSTKENSPNTVYLLLVGDMEINRKEPEKFFEKVLPELKKADIRFGGLEASLSDKGTAVQGKIIMRHSPEMIKGYLAGGLKAWLNEG